MLGFRGNDPGGGGQDFGKGGLIIRDRRLGIAVMVVPRRRIQSADRVSTIFCYKTQYEQSLHIMQVLVVTHVY